MKTTIEDRVERFIYEKNGSQYILNNEEAQKVVIRGINHQDLHLEEFSSKISEEESLILQTSMEYHHFCLDSVNDFMWDIMLDLLTMHM